MAVTAIAPPSGGTSTALPVSTPSAKELTIRPLGSQRESQETSAYSDKPPSCLPLWGVLPAGQTERGKPACFPSASVQSTAWTMGIIRSVIVYHRYQRISRYIIQKILAKSQVCWQLRWCSFTLSNFAMSHCNSKSSLLCWRGQ